MSKLWILTEERPKREVIEIIFTRFAKEKNIGFFCFRHKNYSTC